MIADCLMPQVSFEVCEGVDVGGNTKRTCSTATNARSRLAAQRATGVLAVVVDDGARPQRDARDFRAAAV